MLNGRIILLLSLVLFPASSLAEPVSLTFDDVPGLSLSGSASYAVATNRKLTRALRRRSIPATGFVIGDRFATRPGVRRRLLSLWRAAGLSLGNHTYSHRSLNHSTARRYLAEIDRDDALLQQVAPAASSPRWFRYPYLETGPTESVGRAVATGLAHRGYRVAPVTLENDDDAFAAVYDEAVLAGDRRRAAQIRAAYLAFTEARIAWYRRAAFALFQRHPSLIFLLHDTRLNADSLPSLAAALRRAGLQPVSLDVAMQDPVYALPDGPASSDGDDWLNRWAGVLGRDLPWDDFPEVPSAIARAAARLDPAP